MLRENDYVAGNVKFAGNAQSMARRVFVHHTSFLIEPEAPIGAMEKYLSLPEKRPEYRGSRGHGAFVTGLGESGLGWVRSLDAFYDSILDVLAEDYELEHMTGLVEAEEEAYESGGVPVVGDPFDPEAGGCYGHLVHPDAEVGRVGVDRVLPVFRTSVLDVEGEVEGDREREERIAARRRRSVDP